MARNDGARVLDPEDRGAPGISLGRRSHLAPRRNADIRSDLGGAWARQVFVVSRVRSRRSPRRGRSRLRAWRSVLRMGAPPPRHTSTHRVTQSSHHRRDWLRRARALLVRRPRGYPLRLERESSPQLTRARCDCAAPPKVPSRAGLRSWCVPRALLTTVRHLCKSEEESPCSIHFCPIPMCSRYPS